MRSARQALAARTAAMMEATIAFVDSEDFRTLPARELLRDPEFSTDKCDVEVPRGTPPYLAALYEFPLLNREQEFQLFRKMHFLKYQAAEVQKTLTLSPLNARQLNRVESLLEDAEKIRNRIVQCNLRLVVSIAKVISDPANSLDDLISEGNVPLIRAVEIFDFTRGLRFSTYATWAIRNGLYRVSTRSRQRSQRYRTDDVTLLDAAQPVDASAEELDFPIDREELLERLNQLDARSQTIVRDRFGLTNPAQRPARFRELAAKLRLSTERVRQLLAKALEHLRTAR